MNEPTLERVATFASKELDKSPTGIAGLDEITGGGLPTGRPTLVVGGQGPARPCWGSLSW